MITGFSFKSLVFMPVLGAVLMLFLFSPAGVIAENYEDIEEDADMVLELDRVVTGDVLRYTGNLINLAGEGTFSLCRKVKVFTRQGEGTTVEELETAERLKVFKNGRCVRKVKILRSAR